ncbi:hypothetical protein scyTo_0004618 [Scyliorhinus torazame]|uniref:Uncharacterized protein n=1 Tax=Scyliorhinus torazame TaxID=75743 RepID=A0A401NUH4_SCYTO|nr:hypothetical protein [Scyliorhinus torazame]
MKGNCPELENELIKSKKGFEASEDNNRNAVFKLQKLHTEIGELHQEIEQLNIQKAELQVVMDNLRDTKEQHVSAKNNTLKQQDEQLKGQ